MIKQTVLMLGLSTVLVACGGTEDKPKAAATEATSSAPAAAASAPAAVAAAPAAPAADATASAPVAASSTALAPGQDQAALTAAAKAAMQALGGSLKSELQAAMQSGGPLKALSICNTRAPEIAKSVSDAQQMQVMRVSLRNRNPENAPNAWQTAVLENFEKRKAKGEMAETLVHAETVDGEFRFMKAIPTDAMCLTCHGATLSPELGSKVAELYPADKAVGFNEGDLRGAFVVVKSLQP